MSRPMAQMDFSFCRVAATRLGASYTTRRTELEPMSTMATGPRAMMGEREAGIVFRSETGGNA